MLLDSLPNELYVLDNIVQTIVENCSVFNRQHIHTIKQFLTQARGN